jgi:DMSO/TMAO reductase YedYZ molybdopterin-dependent catalytic subunit
VVRLMGLPGRRKRFTGSYQIGSFRPEEMPVTQWLSDQVPNVDGEGWWLSLWAQGKELRTRSLSQLEAVSEPLRAVIDCTGGWYASQDWEGVRLDRLLPESAVARSILARSATGYSRRFPARDAANLWLITRVGGRPLSAGHGYPARIAAPGRRGFWWVKWVVVLEASDAPWWWQPPYPLQ